MGNWRRVMANLSKFRRELNAMLPEKHKAAEKRRKRYLAACRKAGLLPLLTMPYWPATDIDANNPRPLLVDPGAYDG